MWGTLVVFVLSASLVILAGWELTRRAEDLAERTGLGHAWIGAIVLAGATSLPELSVDLVAVRTGSANFAIGDLFGSCMVNMLALAVADLLTPQVRILTRVVIDQALAGVLAIIVLALAALGVVTGSALAFGGSRVGDGAHRDRLRVGRLAPACHAAGSRVARAGGVADSSTRSTGAECRALRSGHVDPGWCSLVPDRLG